MINVVLRLDVSVLMSVYHGDNPWWFERALDSVLSEQIKIPRQLVLVIDGEISVELNAIVKQYKGSYPDVIEVIRLPTNRGLAYALNTGLRYCRHELVARMDADDICYPERLNLQYEYFMERDYLDILGSSAIDIDRYGNELRKRRVPTDHSDLYKLMWTCPIIHPSVMFRKSKILAVGGYSEALKRRQDYELWFRCAALGYKFANLPEPLIKYRVTDDSFKRNSLSVAWSQYKIGRRGALSLNLGISAQFGVAFPVLKALLPRPLRKILIRLADMFDPRGRKSA